MSATEDETELRDLLIHNLENNGILNKLKAEMRAAVFLAIQEEQDKLVNKTQLVNKNLKRCLSTKDGRLVASLVLDFLQVFKLDFTLAVYQPEVNSTNGLHSRAQVCCELGLSETDVNSNSPLLLELLAKSARHPDKEGDKMTNIPKELSPKTIANARKMFDYYDKDRSGAVLKEDLRRVFRDLFPHFNKNMLKRFISDELKATDQALRTKTDFQEFLGLYKRLSAQCGTVVMGDVSEATRPGFEEKTSKGVELVRGDPSVTSGSGIKGDIGTCPGKPSKAPRDGQSSSSVFLRRALDLDVEEGGGEGGFFIDDPLPKLQKAHGWRVESSRTRGSPGGSSQWDSTQQRRDHRDMQPCRNGTSSSRDRGTKDSTVKKDKSGSLGLGEDVEYDDDFNSRRSHLSKFSELSIGKAITDVSVEGTDISDRFDETTQDLSASQLSQTH